MDQMDQRVCRYLQYLLLISFVTFLRGDPVDYFSDNDDSTYDMYDTPIDHAADEGTPKEKDFFLSSLFSDPIDYYKCQMCVCHNTSSLETSANCRTVARSGMPLHLPGSTSRIDLSNNRYKVMVYKNISMYSNLTHLNMSGNLITSLDNSSCRWVFNVRTFDLAGNRIEAIDDRALSCLPQLTRLYLQYNALKTLTNLTLWGLSKLEYLDMSYNKLKIFEYGAFDPTPELKVLLLGHNKDLSYGKRVFDPRLFLPLEKLEVLSLQRFSPSRQYPLAALNNLPSLNTLQVDGLHDQDQKVNLTGLTNLTTLKYGVDGLCGTTSISQSFFQGLPFLKSIHIERCALKVFSPKAFDFNPFLERINFTDINFSFDLLFSNFLSMQHLPLKVIIFSKITQGLKSVACRTLQGSHSKGLSGLRHLEELYLENNAISLVTKEFLLGLPASLKVLSVKGNMLNRVRTLLNLPVDKGYVFLPNLTALHEDMQGVGDFYRVNPDAEPPVEYQQCERPMESVQFTSRYSNSSMTDTPEENDYDDVDIPETKPSPSPKINLHYYSAVQSFHFGSKFMSGARKRQRYLFKVKYLNISNTYKTSWGSKTLKPWVEVADVSNNFCDKLTNHFLEPNNSLQVLFASGNFLGQDIATDAKGEKLSQFYGVTYLDLSGNHIRSLSYLFFNGLRVTRVLKLTRNDLVSLHVKLSHLTDLKFLDLSRNSISSISKETMDDLDTLAAEHEVFLDLTWNPLPCTCAGSNVIRWLATTNVRLLSPDFLVCLNERNQEEPVGDLTLRMQTLQRLCMSREMALAVSLFSLATVAILLTAVLIYKKRWWIVYMRNVYLAKLYGFKPKTKADGEINYQFDAYMLYSPTDVRFIVTEVVEELERKRGHKLCIEDRDMIAGTYVPCNIVSAITNSRLTIPVLSPDFAHAEWTMYGLQMSVMEASHTKRELVHLLCLRPTDESDMPRVVLKLMKEHHFSEYPPEDCDLAVKKVFWDTLSRKIGHVQDHNEHT